MSEISRLARPLDWRRAQDPTIRTLDALDAEQRERLGKVFRHPYA